MVSHNCKHIDQPLGASGSLGAGGGGGGMGGEGMQFVETQAKKLNNNPMASYSCKPMGLPLAAAASEPLCGSLWEPLGAPESL